MSNLLYIAIIPVILLCLFVYLKDTEKEPLSLLLKIFLLGCLSTIPILIVEMILDSSFPTDDISNIINLFINVTIDIALVEEGFKWLIVKKVGYDNKEFDQVYDIVVYSVFSSMGFAIVENILYVLQSGYGVGIFRALTSIPGHACFGVLMGYYFALSKLAKLNNNENLYKKNLYLSIIVPSLIHSIYDTLLLSENISLFFLWFILLIVTYVICFRKIIQLSKIQNKINNNNFCTNCGNRVFSNFCTNCGKKVE